MDGDVPHDKTEKWKVIYLEIFGLDCEKKW